MTETEQQIALCEWMGWTDCRPSSEPGITWGVKPGETVVLANGKLMADFLPNTNSLDVLHEMEKKLTQEQATSYHFNLVLICDDDKSFIPTYLATAPQRREALLRTLGLWK